MIQEAKGAPQTAPVTPVKIQITSTEKKPHLTVHNTNTNVHYQSNEAKIKELEEKLASMTNEIKEKVQFYSQPPHSDFFRTTSC